jgi:hypothetical protein
MMCASCSLLVRTGRQVLCIATQERKLLVREKGVLESILKSTMEEISRMLEVEALSNEQVDSARQAHSCTNACLHRGSVPVDRTECHARDGAP